MPELITKQPFWQCVLFILIGLYGTAATLIQVKTVTETYVGPNLSIESHTCGTSTENPYDSSH